MYLRYLDLGCERRLSTGLPPCHPGVGALNQQQLSVLPSYEAVVCNFEVRNADAACRGHLPQPFLNRTVARGTKGF
jgi:hypothetical protein